MANMALKIIIYSLIYSVINRSKYHNIKALLQSVKMLIFPNRNSTRYTVQQSALFLLLLYIELLLNKCDYKSH